MTNPIDTRRTSHMQTTHARIEIGSGFGVTTQQPFVSLAWGDKVAQLSIDQAREVGLMLLATADAAIADAFLVGFLKRVADLSDEQAGALLGEFRDYRISRYPQT